MTLISIIGIIYYSVVEVNEETHLAIENHVAAIIKDKLSQQEALTKDYAFWDDTIENAKSVATISVPKDSVCVHHFQIFIDKNLMVRGYQKVDASIDPETEKTHRLVKDLSTIKDD